MGTYGPRFTAGPYGIVGANDAYVGTKAGAIIGLEQPVHPKMTIVADWFSGVSGFGYFTPGVSVTLPHSSLLNVGYSIGNDSYDSGNNNRALFIYYGITSTDNGIPRTRIGVHRASMGMPDAAPALEMLFDIYVTDPRFSDTNEHCLCEFRSCDNIGWLLEQGSDGNRKGNPSASPRALKDFDRSAPQCFPRCIAGRFLFLERIKGSDGFYPLSTEASLLQALKVIPPDMKVGFSNRKFRLSLQFGSCLWETPWSGRSPIGCSGVRAISEPFPTWPQLQRLRSHRTSTDLRRSDFRSNEMSVRLRKTDSFGQLYQSRLQMRSVARALPREFAGNTIEQSGIEPAVVGVDSTAVSFRPGSCMPGLTDSHDRSILTAIRIRIFPSYTSH